MSITKRQFIIEVEDIDDEFHLKAQDIEQMLQLQVDRFSEHGRVELYVEEVEVSDAR